MIYELAKQLREAGYPQAGGEGTMVFRDREKGDGTIEKGAFIKDPSIEELIEECRKLRNFKITITQEGFVIGLSGMENDMEECGTLEEALVKLYVFTKQF